MSLSLWVEGGNSDDVTVLKWDKGLVGHCKIPALRWAKLPSYWREGAVEVRPFPAETGSYVLLRRKALRRSNEGEPDDDGNPQSR